jgi:hypothetical protein
VGNIIGEKFQRDIPAEARVACFVNNAHASPTKFFEDTVV